MTTPRTDAELMDAAASALAARDGMALERLMQTAEDWLEDGATKAARRRALTAMTEAAYLLEGEPSELAA